MFRKNLEISCKEGVHKKKQEIRKYNSMNEKVFHLIFPKDY